MLQGFVLVTAAVYVLVNLAADLLCFRADPRMGGGGGRGARKRRLYVLLALTLLLAAFSLAAPALTPNDPNATDAAHQSSGTRRRLIRWYGPVWPVRLLPGHGRSADLCLFPPWPWWA